MVRGRVTFSASDAEMMNFFYCLEDEGRIFSTNNDRHWRPCNE